MKTRTKLPEDLVQALNDLGCGGRSVYVPFRKKTKSASQAIRERMLATMMEGRLVEIDDYAALLTRRSLYKIKSKAEEEYRLIRRQDRRIEARINEADESIPATSEVPQIVYR